MKCTTVIDPNREEEILIYLKKENAITRQIEELLQSRTPPLIGYGEGRIVPLSPCDIFCVTVENNKIYAVMKEERLQLRERLYTLEERWEDHFVKINQSCLVNIAYIKRFDVSVGGSLLVTLENGYRDYISRRQLKTVKERIGFKL